MTSEKIPEQENQNENSEFLYEVEKPKEVSTEEIYFREQEINEQIFLEETKLKEIRESLGIETDVEEKSFSITELEKERDTNRNKESAQNWDKIDTPEFSESNFYRIINESGYNDLINSGKVRSSPTGAKPTFHIKGSDPNIGRPTPFPSFAKGKPDLTYLEKDSTNYILESEIPMHARGEVNPVTGHQIRGRHWAHRPLDEEGQPRTELPIEEIKNIYKVDKDGDFFMQK